MATGQDIRGERWIAHTSTVQTALSVKRVIVDNSGNFVCEIVRDHEDIFGDRLIALAPEMLDKLIALVERREGAIEEAKELIARATEYDN